MADHSSNNEIQYEEMYRRLKSITDNTPDLISIHDVDGRYVYLSPSFERMLGYNQKDLIMQVPTMIIHADDQSEFNRHLRLLQLSKVEFREPFRLVDSNGALHWYEIVATPLLNSAGDFIGMTCAARDISAQQELEAELTRNQAYLKTILETPSDLIVFSLNRDYEYIEFNNLHKITMKTIWGVDIERGQSMLQYILNDNDRQKAKNNFDRAFEGEEFKIIEAYGDEKLTRTYYEDLYSPMKDDNGNVIGAVVFVKDITDRQQSQNLILEEKERLFVTLRSIGDGVLTIDESGIIDIVNDMAESILGIPKEKLSGYHIDDVFRCMDIDTRRPIENLFDTVIKKVNYNKLIKKYAINLSSGVERHISVRISPIFDRLSLIFGYVLVFHDVTEQERIQAELQKSQKLESIGVLAGGIAHDFNNILMGIAGHVSMMKVFGIKNEAEMTKKIESIENAVLRAKKLTQQLLTFSKGGAPIKQMTDIINLVRESAAFSLHGSNVRLKLTTDIDELPILIDEGQIDQVINNLVINAKQAMPKGGDIEILIRKDFFDYSFNLNNEPGWYVRITIKDNGHGIPKSDLNKIFDPFFTTKENGSGLGLATSYSIINQHKGIITVNSEPENGTQFDVLLPLVTDIEQETVAETETDLVEGEGIVLILEDDPMIQEVIKSILTEIGFHTRVTTHGEETIDVLKQIYADGGRVKIIILDLTIPGGKGGLDVIDELKAVDPAIRFVVSSGYSADEAMSNYEKYGFHGCIAKPFTLEEFNHVINAVLDSGPHA